MKECRIHECGVAEIFDDPASAGLFAEYAEECANPVSGAPIPVRSMYETLERQGAAQCYAAYADKKLCGFALVLKSVIPEYEMRYARVERIFVGAEARGAGVGTTLMRTIEEQARDAGCEDIYYSAPVGSRFARMLALLPEIYPPTSQVFCRKLA